MSKKFKRKYLVNPPFQLKQVSILLVANILTVLLISALLSWFYLIAWDGSAAYNHNQRIPVYIAGCTLLITLATIFLSLRRSRSIAGMMKKIQMVLEDAAIGVFPERRLTFRKSDYFQQLAAPLNDCIDLLRNGQNIDTSETIKELKSLREQIEKPEIYEELQKETVSKVIQKLQ